jgi:site-specific DNA recombinase
VIVGHNRPYGYKVVREPHKAWLVINEEEAKVVKLIFTWHVYGDKENGPLPIRSIAKRLTSMKIPTKNDKQGSSPKTLDYGEWNASSVRYILSNETYCGTWHYCKRLNVNGTPKKRPRKEWIPVEVPAIVSRELWNAAQRQLKLNRQRARRNTKHNYLLSGLLRCGQCGYRLLGGGQTKTKTGKIYYYRCGKKNTIYGDQRCRSRYINAGVADTRVWEAIRAILLDPDALIMGLQQGQVEAERANQSLQERVELIRDGIAGCERQLAKLLGLYLSDRDFPEELLEERRKALERQKMELEHERDDLVAKLKKRVVTDATIEEVKAFCKQVAKGLDNVNFEDKRRILELLDIQGTVIEEDGGQRIVLSGAFPQKRDTSIEISTLSRAHSQRRD